MTADTRNRRVVIALIAAMTFGAIVLLVLESLQPRTPVWSADTLLLAERGERVSEVVIELVPPGAPQRLAGFDCLIRADGRCVWRPRGSRVRLGVLATGGERLAAPQAQSLLVVLGTMYQTRGLDLRRVHFVAQRVGGGSGYVSAEARDLASLLARKGIGR